MTRNRTTSGIGLILFFLLLIGAVVLIRYGHALVLQIAPPWWGFVPIAMAVALVIGTTGQWNPLALACGADRRLSLSKFQTLFWTLVVLYAYSAIYVYDLKLMLTRPELVPRPAIAAQTTTTAVAPGTTTTTPGTATSSTTSTTTTTTTTTATTASPVASVATVPIDFPQSVLLLLGFSVTTLVGAAGITRSQVASGAVKKTPADTFDLSLKWLVLDDNERVDLTRFQVLLWTLVAGFVFFGDTLYFLGSGVWTPALPDVGSALVLLMGLGQAAYLGGKLVVTSGLPVIHNVSTPAATRGSDVTINGTGFGAASPGSTVRLNGGSVATSATSRWSDTAITFTIPAAAQPWDMQPWPVAGTKLPVDVTVVVGALTSEPEALTVVT